MIRITAFIRPHRLEAVKSAISAAGAGGLTVSDVRGRGSSEEAPRWPGAGGSPLAPFPIRTRIEIIAEDSLMEPLIDAILSSAPTGEPGDGKIFVTPVESAVRIRTGEQDELSL